MNESRLRTTSLWVCTHHVFTSSHECVRLWHSWDATSGGMRCGESGARDRVVQSVCCWWKGERSQTFFLLPSRRSRSLASVPSSLLFSTSSLFWTRFFECYFWTLVKAIFYTCIYHTCIDSKEHLKRTLEKDIWAPRSPRFARLSRRPAYLKGHEKHRWALRSPHFARLTRRPVHLKGHLKGHVKRLDGRLALLASLGSLGALCVWKSMWKGHLKRIDGRLARLASLGSFGARVYCAVLVFRF